MNRIAMMVAAVLALAGCDPDLRRPAGWTVWQAAPAPEPFLVVAPPDNVPLSFLREIEVCIAVIQEQQGIPDEEWGGRVIVYGSVEQLGAWGKARVEDGRVRVVYQPAEGAGPEVGTTAIEHELCHVARWIIAGDTSEEGANACAGAAYGEVLARL